MNDGSGTRYNSGQNIESVIDLTLVSQEIAGISRWEVLNKSSVGSDHYPIIVKTGIEVYHGEDPRIPRWKLDRADWETFKIFCKNKCEGLIRENLSDVDEFNKKWWELL